MKTTDMTINLALKQHMKRELEKKIEFMLSSTDTICHARSCTHHFNLENRRQFLNFDMKYYVVSFTWTSWQRGSCEMNVCSCVTCIHNDL